MCLKHVVMKWFKLGWLSCAKWPVWSMGRLIELAGFGQSVLELELLVVVLRPGETS